MNIQIIIWNLIACTCIFSLIINFLFVRQCRCKIRTLLINEDRQYRCENPIVDQIGIDYFKKSAY